MKIYSPDEVIKRIKDITKDNYDSDLAERIGVHKQSLSQYKNKNSIDVQLRLISLLLSTIDENISNKKIQRTQKDASLI